MTNAENGKKYSIIAAICFAAVAVIGVIFDIIYYSGNEYRSLSFFNILGLAILIGFSVTLFINNRFAVTIVSGIYALYYVYDIVRDFSLQGLLHSLVGVTVVVILVLSLKNNQITKKIFTKNNWFFGAVLLFVGTLISLWDQRGYLENNTSDAWILILMGLVFRVVKIVPFLFVGLWVKESITSSQTAPVNEYATFSPQKYSNPTESNDAIGGADKLKMYKELLDSGTITQEEFDAKKKQILGL